MVRRTRQFLESFRAQQMKKKASYISYVLGVVDSDCEGIIRLEISSRCDKVDTEGFAKIWWPRSRENMYIWIVDVAKKKKRDILCFYLQNLASCKWKRYLFPGTRTTQNTPSTLTLPSLYNLWREGRMRERRET